MKGTFKSVLALVFVLVVLVQIYLGVVQAVEAIGSDSILKSFTLKSSRGSNIADRFVVGDTLRLVVTSDVARAYRFKIYRNASVIFESGGDFNGSVAEAHVPLNPPVFGVGRYFAVFDVYGYDSPILGVKSFDSQIRMFEVTSVETKLAVNAAYDDFLGSLCLRANLTDCNGYPVVNETVSFGIRSSERRQPTDGWYPLGSSVTDSGGVAALDLVICVKDGDYSFKVSHAGNGNFGESSDVVSTEIVSKVSFGRVSNGLFSSGLPIISISLNGTLNAWACKNDPYSLMPLTVTAEYWIDSPFEEDVRMDYYLDNVSTHRGGHTFLTPRHVGAFYVYDTVFYWEAPNVSGSHVINVTVSVGSERMHDYAEIAHKEIYLQFRRCPTNMAVRWAPSSYGVMLPVIVAFSKPRTYEASPTGFFVSTSSAPKIEYCGSTYAIDAPLASCPVKLCVNGSQQLQETNDDGLTVFPVRLGTDKRRFTLNATAVADGTDLACDCSYKRVINVTMVEVQDLRNRENTCFKFNYTVLGCGGNVSKTYIGANNTIRAEAFLFDSPICNATLSFIAARELCRINVTANTEIPDPQLSDYLRVVSINMTKPNYRVRADFNTGKSYVDTQNCSAISQFATRLNLTYVPIGDVNDDGKINVLDLIAVASSLGSKVGDSNYNVCYDLNLDGKINVLDIIVVQSNMGALPRPIKGVVELFHMTLNATDLTDNTGQARKLWVPPNVGDYLVQVKTSQRFISTATQSNSTLYVGTSVNRARYYHVIKRPANLTLDVEGNYSNPLASFTVAAYDPVICKPVSGLEIKLYASPFYLGIGFTNASGEAVFSWTYYKNTVYMVLAISSQNETYEAGRVQGYLDPRFPMNITPCDGELVRVRYVNIPCTYNFTLSSSFGPGIGCLAVCLCINGTFTNGTSCSKLLFAYSLSDGRVSFSWAAPCEGAYSMRAFFSSGFLPSNNACYKDCECHVLVEATATPLAVMFSVSETDFAPPKSLALNATVLDIVTGGRVGGSFGVKVEFWRFISNGTVRSLGVVDAINGVALLSGVLYPDDGNVHAFMAKVKAEYSGSVLPQGVSGNPVQLTISKSTRILLNVTRGENSEHVVRGWLKYGGSAVGSKPVTVMVNETKYILTTNQSGYFSKSLTLLPRDNKQTLYTVTASFEGDQAKNATAWAQTLDGQRYAACTAIQYGFRPSANSTTLTVQPQATQTATQTKTPEQMQQDAQNSGWLSIYNEFSWWYPWYRLHFVGKWSGETLIDVGVAALPFADTSYLPDTTFKGKMNEWLGKIVFNVLTSVVVTEFALWAASNGGLLYFAIILGGYLVYKTVNLFVLGWNSVESLYVSLVSTLISTAISAWTGLCSFLLANLRTLAAGAESIKNVAFAFLCKIIMIPINIWLLTMTWNRIVELGGA